MVTAQTFTRSTAITEGTTSFYGFAELPFDLPEQLHELNPWWAGKPGRVLPSYRRWAFREVKSKLQAGLAPAVVVRGPRQVGKTTLQEQLIEDLLAEGVPPTHLFRVQFDDIPALRALKQPILTLARWYQRYILRETFNETARQGRPAYIFLDEVQNLSDWAPQVKALVDTWTVKVLVTGSSALRIEAGRDSLAGRITTVEMGPFLVREIAELNFQTSLKPLLGSNGLEDLKEPDFWQHVVQFGIENREDRDRAFSLFSERGGYPVAYVSGASVPWAQVADQLNETVIQRVIQHDLRMGDKGRKRDERLLEEVFRLVCRYAGQAPGQAVYVQELHRSMGANIGWQRVLSYLKFLEGSLLVALIAPLEIRLKRRRGNYKLCLSDHGLRASWLQEIIPLDPVQLEKSSHLTDLAGHLAESVVGYFFNGLPHLDVAHFPERGAEPEVDFVLTIGDRRIPVEVKYRRHIDQHRDTLGLRSFVEKAVNNAPFGVLVTQMDGPPLSDPRIISVPLSSLLLMR
ncbi:MAG TPA: ATP-binding protein [Dehalococcoidia bacterium]|nr:ATP-binding protein [Dehalococcoidia bacterium]